ncbi:hypothetical protein AX14_011819 [Amanita brunnescens Koide BX004]|nr:hypothetical protein AX14_011819 [Amanita brunnescens Koide BX004]
MPAGDSIGSMLEVAEGVQYLHSEGIVHGDIKGDNILLDSNFRCKIADFGFTRRSDAIATATQGCTPHYAAPGLFGKCSVCNQRQYNGCHGKRGVQKKPMESDVYAFGCLYCAVSLSMIPQQAYSSIPFLTEGIFFPHWLARHNRKTVENPKNAREALETHQRLLEVPCF